MKLRIVSALLLAGTTVLNGCGKDEADFNSLKDEVGIINGNFNLRLGVAFRDKIDALQVKLDDIVPGASNLLFARFGDTDGATGSGDTKFSDLFKIKIPGSSSKIANQLMFAQLQELKGDSGLPYFDLVDNNKFVKKPAYIAPENGANADPKMPDQYYLEMIKWKEGVAQLSDAMLAAAAPVVVAVLDTGVNASHADLTNVMWKNSGAAVGYDAALGAALSKTDSIDGNGHGTHVAGIIGGQGANGVGIHGIAGIPYAAGTATKHLAEIMNVKVLNDNGAGTSEEISTGVKWAVDQHKIQKASAGRTNQKLVINMSLGGPFDASGYSFKTEEGKLVFEDDMINYAGANDDVLVIVAAGNDSCGIGGLCDMYDQSFYQAYYFPCSYKNVLCVAATTHEDELAGFSNRRGSVGLAAPGYQIVSTSKSGDYEYYSGTSQATPVTAGAAAVVWAMYPGFKGTDIKKILQKSASKLSEVTGQLLSGDGRLNLDAALKYAAALKSGGSVPDSMEPDASLLSTEKVTPGTQPTAGTLGPKDTSPTAKPGAGPESKGDGSANGCATVGVAHHGMALLLFGFLLPLCFRRRRI